MSDAVSGFLHLLKEEPTLLGPAPVDCPSTQMDQRAAQAHSCLRCGEKANAAFIADTKIGPRWLDLCWKCAGWLRRGI